jgi:UDP-GlcNAc:undecaprenyl-phosphate GlcNAc-1-phosphate transferase
MFLRYGIIFIGIILLSAASNYVSIWLAKKINLIDYPGSASHKLHERATPLSGGLSVVLTLIIYFLLNNDWLEKKWMGLLIGALIIFLFGLWDDLYKFAYSTKLLGQILGAMVLIASGISINFFEVQNLFWLNWIISLLWIIGVVNAYNFIDSMDDIVIGISIISFACLAIFFYNNNNDFLTEFSIVLTGLSFVSYFFNRTPARMFLGDSGAQTLGFFVASLCLLFVRENPHQPSTYIPPIILLGVPIFNITLVVISRVRRGIPVYKARLDQIYHRILKFGINEQTSVNIIHIVSVLLGTIAILTLFIPQIWGYVVFLILLLIGFILINKLDNKQLWP